MEWPIKRDLHCVEQEKHLGGENTVAGGKCSSGGEHHCTNDSDIGKYRNTVSTKKVELASFYQVISTFCKGIMRSKQLLAKCAGLLQVALLLDSKSFQQQLNAQGGKIYCVKIKKLVRKI